MGESDAGAWFIVALFLLGAWEVVEIVAWFLSHLAWV